MDTIKFLGVGTIVKCLKAPKVGKCTAGVEYAVEIAETILALPKIKDDLGMLIDVNTLLVPEQPEMQEFSITSAIWQ